MILREQAKFDMENYATYFTMMYKTGYEVLLSDFGISF